MWISPSRSKSPKPSHQKRASKSPKRHISGRSKSPSKSRSRSLSR
ncbi:hypothetical protein OROHE_025690 [Orobanche hederae]